MNLKETSFLLKRKLFTLIELLVVIGIIGVLAVMLVAGLSSAQKKTKTLTCLDNQKNIGVALASFTGDNYGKYPCSQGKISWDDLLSQYDGRNLTEDQLEDSALSADESKKIHEYAPRSLNEMYQCPEDEIDGITTRRFDDSLNRRSYALNGNKMQKGTARYRGARYKNSIITGIAYDDVSNSVTTIQDPTGTIALADCPGEKNRLGGSTISNGSSKTVIGYIQTASGSFNKKEITSGSLSKLDYPELHGDFMANYLFCDGHASTMKAKDTTKRNIVGKSKDMKGMWTGKSGD